MQLTQNVIDEILQKTNIVEVVGDYVSLEKKGRNYVGLCPFHADNNPSMSVSEEKHIFKCFSCGAGGNAIKFVQDIEHISFPEAARKVADKVGISIDVKRNPFQKFYELNKAATAFFKVYLLNTQEGKKAMQYLASRGISDATIQAFDIGLSPNKHLLYEAMRKRQFEPLDMITAGLVNKIDDEYLDTFRGRIMFPIKDKIGNIVGFSGRSLQNDAKAKYINTAESAVFKKSKILYHLDSAKQHVKEANRIVLMEGYMDVIAAHNAGVKEAVATMGTALTKDHVRLLDSITKNIVICFDGDDAGVEAAFKSVQSLKGFDLSIVVLPNKQDPDDFIKQNGDEAFRSFLSNNGMDAIQFLYQYHLSKVDQTNITDLERFKQEIFRYLRGSSNVQIELYLNRLAQTLNVSLESIKNDFLLKKRVVTTNKTEKPKEFQKYLRAELMLIGQLTQSKDKALLLNRKLDLVDVIISQDNLHLREAIIRYYRTNEIFVLDTFLNTISTHMQEYFVNAVSIDKPLSERAVNDCIETLYLYKLYSRYNFLQEERMRGTLTNEQIKEYFELQKQIKGNRSHE